MNARWETITNRTRDTQHVVPINDFIAHTLNDCVCGPREELHPQPGRRDQYLYVHASLDGREHHE